MKILANHTIKSLIKLFIEITQLSDDIRRNVRVPPSFGFPQAAWPYLSIRSFETGEAFLAVKEEMSRTHQLAQPQKFLNSIHLADRIMDELFPADEKHLFNGEIF